MVRLAVAGDGESRRRAAPQLAVVALARTRCRRRHVAIVGATVTSTVALRIDDVARGIAKFFYIFSIIIVLGRQASASVVFIAAVTALSYRTKLFAPWINVVGWLARHW